MTARFLKNQSQATAEQATPEFLATLILAVLPKDGTPLPNHFIQSMLARELDTQIEPMFFFAARELLFKQRKVGGTRGPGGQIFLAGPLTSAKVEPLDRSEPWPETRLMLPLRAYLEGPFRKGLDAPRDAIVTVHDTSAIGTPSGRWTRPDFVLISAMRFKFLPGAQVDVHSFELKTETGGSVPAVHEALAQTRFTHFGHLVWHLPPGSKAEARLIEIKEQCEEHGIGLIRMRDAFSQAGDCEILVEPVRKRTMPAAIEAFLEARLATAQKERLAGLMRDK